MPHAGSPDFGVSRQLRMFNKIPNYPASTLGVAVQSGSCVEFLGGSESATAVPEGCHRMDARRDGCAVPNARNEAS